MIVLVLAEAVSVIKKINIGVSRPWHNTTVSNKI